MPTHDLITKYTLPKIDIILPKWCFFRKQWALALGFGKPYYASRYVTTICTNHISFNWLYDDVRLECDQQYNTEYVNQIQQEIKVMSYYVTILNIWTLLI